MRIELAGTLVRPDPAVVTFNQDGTFSPQQYIDQGYSHFDVICIGAGGGRGGGINDPAGTTVRNYGGEGGGGGFHRVRGLLSELPASCAVVVGTPGANGTDQVSNPALTTDGADGEASTFNGVTCRASGGTGGKRAQTNSTTVSTQADGGVGGIGDRTIAGGGALGGEAGTPTATGPGTPGTNGADGTFFQNIGKGGGGGAGGVGKYDDTVCNAATSGGRGAYNPGDTSVYGPAGIPVADPDSGANNIVPGKAGGAKASPLNGLPTVYGRSSNPGVVVVRLTAE